MQMRSAVREAQSLDAAWNRDLKHMNPSKDKFEPTRRHVSKLNCELSG